MTIVHVIWSAALGGIQRMVLDLATEQVKAGHRIIIVICKQGGAMEELYAAGPWESVTLSVRNAAVVSFGAVRRLIPILRSTDILHMHEYVLHVDVATRIVRTPTVFTEHGLFASGRRLNIRDRLFRIPKKYFLNNRVDAWIANSRYSKTRINEIYGDDRPVEVIYNGYAFDRIQQKKAPATQEGFCVACIGRLAGVKRFDWVLRAFGELQAGPMDTLLIVGEGELKTELAALAEQLGIETHVQFVGYTEDVQGLLASVTVVAAPSAGEAFGLVALDAMAAAKPIIVTEDGGGLVELVAGVLPENVVGNVQQLTERLAYYRHDQQKAAADGQVFSDEQEKYTSFRTQNEYARVYAALHAGDSNAA